MVGTRSGLSGSASFDVRPVRSQVVLVGLTIAAVVALLVGGGLFALDKPSGWLFVCLSAVLLASVVWCWQQSHRDTDLADSHPTQVVLPDGTNLSTDSRLLYSQNGALIVARAFHSLVLRDPLPEPSGMVRPDATLIPDSKQKAVDTIEKINTANQTIHDQAFALLQGQLSIDSVIQAPGDSREHPIGATRDAGTLNAVIESSPIADPPGCIGPSDVPPELSRG